MSEFLRFNWATVTSVSPLRVRMDGDTTALPFTPDSLTDPSLLAVNDRVRCEISERKIVIIGRSGGSPLLATNAETQAGTSTTRAVTPAGLASRTSTTTRTGIVELATDAEAVTGTDTSRAVTPSGLAAAVGKIQTLYGTFSNSTWNSGVGNSGLVWWGERTVTFGVTFVQVPAISIYGLTTGAVMACTVLSASTTSFTFRAIRFQAALSGTYDFAWTAVGRVS